jgi:hypothetical protein
MSMPSFVFQGLSAHSHDQSLAELLEMANLTDFLAGVAFVRESGVEYIATRLSALGDRASFFVGIRNDITSLQGVSAEVDPGIRASR